MSIGKGLIAIARGLTPTHLHLRQRLSALILLTVVFDLVASVIALMVERDAPSSEIHNWGDALFWTTTQVLTVSSSLENPVTTPGRLLDVVLELYGITVVAALAGSFGTYFHRRGLERDPLTPDAGPSA